MYVIFLHCAIERGHFNTLFISLYLQGEGKDLEETLELWWHHVYHDVESLVSNFRPRNVEHFWEISYIYIKQIFLEISILAIGVVLLPVVRCLDE